MKYGLSTLMLVVFAASIICGIALKGSFAAFAIGFMSAAVWLMNLLASSGPRPVVAHEVANESDAYMLRNYLVEHGLDARLEGVSGAAYPSLARPRVVVPTAQAAQMIDLLRQLKERGDPPGPRGRSASWTTVLHNCNCHSFDEVIRSLMSTLRCSQEQASEIAWQVHNLGHAVIRVGTEDECTRLAESLAESGLHTEVVPGAPAAVSNSSEEQTDS